MGAIGSKSDIQHVERRIDYRTAEYRRLGLVFVCAVVGLLAGFWGGSFAASVAWDSVAFTVGQLAAAAIVTVAVLRFVDVIALRRENSALARYSEGLAAETRALIEARFPGTAERAAKIDAGDLLYGSSRHSPEWGKPLV
jgi:hypothetical protein